jgi:S1-C subfamily serine protease
VTEVVAGGPSEKAGLKVGDVILKVNDTTLDATNDLAKVLSSLKPGDSAKLNVQHKGESAALDISVTLGDNPDKAGQAYLGIQYISGGQGPKFGNGQTLPQRPNNSDPNLPKIPNHAGLVVAEVKAGSPAEKAGIKVNDVITEINGKAAGTPDELVKLVQAAKIGDTLTLTILRKGESNTLKVEATLTANPDQKDQAYLGVSIGGMMRGFQRGGRNNVIPTPNPSISGGNS